MKIRKHLSGWYFLLSYLAYSAYTVDFVARMFIQTELASLYQLDPASLITYAQLNNVGLIFGVIVFGCLVDQLSFKTCFVLVWFVQMLGIIKLTLLSSGINMTTLHHHFRVSMILMGMGEGGIFALIHPLIAQAFRKPQQSQINIMQYLHTNWPLIMIIGCLFEFYIKNQHISWLFNVYSMYLFPCLYLLLALILPMPSCSLSHPIPLSSKIRSALRPGFILLFFCMIFTTLIQYTPQSWFANVIHQSLHMHWLAYIVLINAIQLVLRLSCRLITRWIAPPGLLAMAAVLSCLSLGLLGLNIHWTINFIAIVLFASSIAEYWPTFIAIVIDRYPLTGSFGMALMNDAAYLSFTFLVPSMAPIAQYIGVDRAFYILSLIAVLSVVLLIAINAFFRAQGGYKVMSAAELSV